MNVKTKIAVRVRDEVERPQMRAYLQNSFEDRGRRIGEAFEQMALVHAMWGPRICP